MTAAYDDDFKFGIGDQVQRKNSDYRFPGTCVMRGRKRSGEIRYVFEDDRGILFIGNDRDWEPRDPQAARRENVLFELAHAAEDLINFERVRDFDRLKQAIASFHETYPEEDGNDRDRRP